MSTRRFTILHSNDMHGDFLSEQGPDGLEIGGLALLAGYLRRAREESTNVLYAIAGDMVQGSIIDSEYKGISTVEIMNFLAPDVVTLGNHEFDYGLPQLLFLEKLAQFPIVNANLYLKRPYKRLMQPYVVLERDGFGILVIGVITEKVIDALKSDAEIGSFISLEEARKEIGAICNAYRNDDIDLTILLTHLGLESDVELARLLDPAWGVDMIIGGHSHTAMDAPQEVNGVLVVQTGGGTNQIGRFEIEVDDDTNSIASWTWRTDRIDSSTVQPDPQLDALIDGYQADVDAKYSKILSRLAEVHTHPKREIETALGNLVADAIAERSRADVVLMGSGSIRQVELGPVVTLGTFTACFPYDDVLLRYSVSGEALRRAFERWMRAENRTGEGECYQVNAGVQATYDEAAGSLVSLHVAGEPVDDEAIYTIALQGYHALSAESFLALSPADLTAVGEPTTVATSVQDVLRAFFETSQNAGRKVEGRLVYR